MRRSGFGFGLFWLLLTILIAGGAAAIGYQAGASGTSVPIWVGLGFGFFGWLPFLFLILLLVGFLARPRWHGGHGTHGRERFEGRLRDWHRREHGEAPPEDKVSV